MGVLSNIAAVAGTVAAGVVVNVLSSEVSAWAPIWANRIVHWAACLSPEAERTAVEAEWLAHIEQIPGGVVKMLHACGMWRAAAFSPINRKLIFDVCQIGFLPLIFVLSLYSTMVDYIAGRENMLFVDALPGVSVFMTVTGALAVAAWRHRQAQKAKVEIAPVDRVKL